MKNKKQKTIEILKEKLKKNKKEQKNYLKSVVNIIYFYVSF